LNPKPQQVMQSIKRLRL